MVRWPTAPPGGHTTYRLEVRTLVPEGQEVFLPVGTLQVMFYITRKLQGSHKKSCSHLAHFHTLGFKLLSASYKVHTIYMFVRGTIKMFITIPALMSNWFSLLFCNDNFGLRVALFTRKRLNYERSGALFWF